MRDKILIILTNFGLSSVALSRSLTKKTNSCTLSFCADSISFFGFSEPSSSIRIPSTFSVIYFTKKLPPRPCPPERRTLLPSIGALCCIRPIIFRASLSSFFVKLLIASNVSVFGRMLPKSVAAMASSASLMFFMGGYPWS